MTSAEGPGPHGEPADLPLAPLPNDGVGAAEPRPGRRRRRATVAAVLVLVAVVFARATRSEVRYETDPAGAEPLEQRAVDDLAGASAGTRCGGWPASLSTSIEPRVAPLHTALWADAAAFHVQTAHVYVRAVRFDVEGGTATTPGADAQASLTVPLTAGATADVTVACRATAVTVRLLGADGEDVAGAALEVGTQAAEPGPIELTKGGQAAAPRALGCLELADAARALGAAPTDEARIAAATNLVDVIRADVASVAGSLSEEERRDADAVIALIEARIADLRSGRADADRPANDADLAAMDGMARAYERLCG